MCHLCHLAPYPLCPILLKCGTSGTSGTYSAKDINYYIFSAICATIISLALYVPLVPHLSIALYVPLVPLAPYLLCPIILKCVTSGTCGTYSAKDINYYIFSAICATCATIISLAQYVPLSAKDIIIYIFSAIVYIFSAIIVAQVAHIALKI